MLRANDDFLALPRMDPTTLVPDDAPMDETDLQAAVQALISDAVDYIDGTVAPMRQELMQLESGELPLKPDEDENRSGITTRDVRDTIEMLMPDVMRVFFSTENVAEFSPQGPEDAERAEQATDYVNHVILRQNKGFLTLYTAIKDALSVKMGFVKTWWDTSTKVKDTTYSGLDPEALALVQAELGPNDTLTVTGQRVVNAPEGPLPLVDVRTRRYVSYGRICNAAVPQEEFFIDRRATCIDDSLVHGQRQFLPAHEVVAMGIDKETVLQYVSASDSFDQNLETFTRNPAAEFPFGSDPEQMNQRVLYVEAYVRLDTDRDGLAEFYKVICLGSEYNLVSFEPWDRSPFSAFAANIKTHTFFPDCAADLAADIQVAKTGLWRAMMDSLAQSVRPRTAVVEGQVNIRDVLSNDTGGIVRMRAPGMAQPLETPFVGQQVIPVLGLMDEMRESRTGVSKAAAGLDADALQSSTKDAVQATISKGQAQVEMICRVLAETGWQSLIQNVYHLLRKHQDRELMVRLRNRWVPIDPRCWPEQADVTINVALGRGSDNVRMGYLMQIAEKQEQILTTLGPDNPLTSVEKFRYTLAQMTSLAGFKDANAFWNDPATYEPQNQNPPQEDPAMLVARAEAEKKHKEAEVAELKAKSDADARRDEIVLKAIETCTKTGYPLAEVLAFLTMPRGDGGTSVAGGAPGVTPVPALAAAPPQPGNPMAPQPPAPSPFPGA
jgi:hypothetical protein